MRTIATNLAIIAWLTSVCLAGDLTLTPQPTRVVLKNARATAVILKSTGEVIDYRCNDEVNLVEGIHIHKEFLTGNCDEFQILHNDDKLVEIGYVFLRRLDPADGDPSLGLRIELRYAMTPDSPGLYAYFVWKVVGGPAVQKYPLLNRTNVSKFRIVTTGKPYYYVDEDRNGLYPMHGLEKMKTNANATWIFSDGTVRSKYDDLSIQHKERLIGKYNDTHGIFFIIPSNEWAGGGPFKQRVCQQYDSLMFMHLLDGHCGLPAKQPIFTEGWEHVFGPWLISIGRAASKEDVLAAAKAQADREIAQWPYAWLSHRAYAADARVKVRGRLRLTDGASPDGAFILLGDPGMHYQERVQNYLYASRADARGDFVLPSVRPGTHKLYAFVKGVLGEYVKEGVVIAAGKETDLGEVAWTPEKFGETLWQIGVPDRTGEEFLWGKYHHQWGMHILYPQAFPKDVDFFVGKSRESADWPYFHLTARTWDDIQDYNLGYHWDDTIHRLRFDFANDKLPDKNDRSRFDPFSPVPYRIHFDVSKRYQGQATLSLAVAGTMFEGPLLVQVNGTDVTGPKPLRFPNAATLRRCAGTSIHRRRLLKRSDHRRVAQVSQPWTPSCGFGAIGWPPRTLRNSSNTRQR